MDSLQEGTEFEPLVAPWVMQPDEVVEVVADLAARFVEPTGGNVGC